MHPFLPIIALLLTLVSVASSSGQDGTKRPNFVFILSDDQDLQMDSMNYMQGVKTHLTEQGAYFNHHFCTVALCCPSRVNMWTGKAAHNTNVTDLAPPYGGYPKFIKEGYYNKWLPTWLQNAGYKTYFTGKLMNSHTIHNYREKLDELSLDGHDFMIEPGTYQYLNTTMQHDMEDPVIYPGIYATDLLANRSLAWLDIAAKEDAPFFLAINPVNPHANSDWNKGFTPPIPAERYKNDFPGVKVPRTANFNPDKPSGASWVKELPRLNPEQIESNDDNYRRRLQALQAVDDLVNRTIDRLDSYNLLDNTYIIYTSDNGFHISQHRLSPGKRCPYEEDVSIPLVIRGPGIPQGVTIDFVTSHTDLAPTIVSWASADGPADFDGVPIPIPTSLSLSPQNPAQPWEHVSIEHWGSVSDDAVHAHDRSINTYKALRLISASYSLYYAVWCDGSRELYDMASDPAQMTNLYDDGGGTHNGSSTLPGAVSTAQLTARLDALLLVLKTCAGATCRRPWSALHPHAGADFTLLDALAARFDAFYAAQNKVGFERCEEGYIVSNELPIEYLVFGGGVGGGGGVGVGENVGNMSEREVREEAWRNWYLFTD